jgi:hypothetical protein
VLPTGGCRQTPLSLRRGHVRGWGGLGLACDKARAWAQVDDHQEGCEPLPAMTPIGAIAPPIRTKPSSRGQPQQ